jgi:DNA-binding GntR family transcriptional regulator
VPSRTAVARYHASVNKSPNATPARPRPSRGEGVQYVTDWLREEIISLRIEPGSHVDEVALVKELGVSRTPVREALVRLMAEGLVVLLPNRSARVTGLDISNIRDHLEAFELMQRAATRLASLRRTDQDLVELRHWCDEFERAAKTNNAKNLTETNWRLHRAIGAACGNEHFARYYNQLLIEGLRIARLAMGRQFYGSSQAYSQHIGQILAEHTQLVAAIVARDADRAEQLAQSHTELARKRILEYFGRAESLSINLSAFDK